MPYPSNEAHRAPVASPGDASRQGGRLTALGRSPVSRVIGLAGLYLGLFALASMGLNALPYLTGDGL